MAEPQIPEFKEETDDLLAPIEGRIGETEDPHMDEEMYLRIDVRNALRYAYMRGWNAFRGHGFDRKEDGTRVPRPGTCPMPMSDNWSAEHCQQAGNCGCDLKVRLAAIPEDGKKWT